MEYNIKVLMSKTIYSKDHKSIVERLQKARLEANLDQKEVAKLTFCGQ